VHGNSERGKNSGMKAKFIILGIISGAVITIFIMMMIGKPGVKSIDNMQRSFVTSRGFLASQDIGIDSYAKAISILRQQGLNMQFFEKPRTTGQNLTIPKTASNEFVKLVIKGAKAKKLGIKTPGPFTSDIYTLNNERFEYKDFELLSKAIAYFAQVELSEKGDIDKAALLGYVNLALGTQLSEYNVDFIHMLGIGCKGLGLKTLEEYATARNDDNLMELVLEMQQERDKEFEIIKNMPAAAPSFWDFFRQCIKTESGVGESGQ